MTISTAVRELKEELDQPPRLFDQKLGSCVVVSEKTARTAMLLLESQMGRAMPESPITKKQAMKALSYLHTVKMGPDTDTRNTYRGQAKELGLEEAEWIVIAVLNSLGYNHGSEDPDVF